MEAESIEKVMLDATAAARTFNRIILGFMALGLIVGVAALGVISARAIVERRQQIGVLRAIGFRRAMIEAALLLESSFVALTAIVVGSGLGGPEHHSRLPEPTQLGQPDARRPLGEPGDHLRHGLRRGPPGHVGAGRSRLAHQAGRGTALPIAA